MLPRATWVLKLFFLLVPRPLWASTEVTITYSPHALGSAQAAARQLSNRLDVAPAIRTTTTTDLPQLLEQARGPWDAQFLVVLAPERGVATVIRTEDGTALSRLLDREVLESPYAFAVAAAELLELARRPRSDPDAPDMMPVLPGIWSLGVNFGIGVGTGLGDGPLIFEPSVGAMLIRHLDGRRWWGGAGLRGRFLGKATATLPGSLVVDYRREEITAHLALGLSADLVDVSVSLGLATELTHAWVENANDDAVARQDRVYIWVPVGGELRLHLGSGLSLAVGAEVGLVPRPARYLVADQATIEEGALRGQATLSLWYVLGPG